MPVAFFTITVRAQEPTLAGAEKIDCRLERGITVYTSMQPGTVAKAGKKV
jgi:hypothetical protein